MMDDSVHAVVQMDESGRVTIPHEARKALGVEDVSALFGLSIEVEKTEVGDADT